MTAFMLSLRIVISIIAVIIMPVQWIYGKAVEIMRSNRESGK